jgi:hypothetical protein
MKMKMQSAIRFTARKKFAPGFNALDWEGYIKWSGLTHLTELVSLDGILNGLAFEPDFEREMDEMLFDENMLMPFYQSMDYVVKKSDDLDDYNLLAVIKEPTGEKQTQLENDFDFIGYDLIEQNGIISALANCGGFDETFHPKELHQYGLISDYARAKEIQMAFPMNNPEEPHADCFLYEVWRHKMIGKR